MSVYESSITNPKKQLEFYKDLSEQLLKENEKLHHYKTLYQSLKMQKEELRSWLEEMLDNKDDIFSVIRVKDVLSKLEELEGVNDDKIN